MVIFIYPHWTVGCFRKNAWGKPPPAGNSRRHPPVLVALQRSRFWQNPLRLDPGFMGNLGFIEVPKRKLSTWMSRDGSDRIKGDRISVFFSPQGIRSPFISILGEIKPSDPITILSWPKTDLGSSILAVWVKSTFFVFPARKLGAWKTTPWKSLKLTIRQVFGFPPAKKSNRFWPNISDLTRPHPKWWFSKEKNPISGKTWLVKYYNLAR